MERVGTSLAWTVCDFRKVQFCPWFQWCEERVSNLDLSVSEFLGNSFKAMPTPTCISTRVWKRRCCSSCWSGAPFCRWVVLSSAQQRGLGHGQNPGRPWAHSGAVVSSEAPETQRRQLCGRDLGGLLPPVPCAWDQCELRHCPAKEQHVALGWLHKIHPTL